MFDTCLDKEFSVKSLNHMYFFHHRGNVAARNTKQFSVLCVTACSSPHRYTTGGKLRYMFDMNMKGGIVSFDLLFKIILGRFVLLLAGRQKRDDRKRGRRDDMRQKFSAGF